MLVAARHRLIDAVGDAHALSEHDREARAALDATTTLIPQLPDMVESALDRAMGDADARIFSRSQLRRFLADYAIEMVLAQAGAIGRWTVARARRRFRHGEEG